MQYRFLRFPGGKPKAVTLSYDDGVLQDKRFSDIITKNGLKCTFNINSAFIGTENKLTKQEIKEYILERGHEIAVHGEYHRANGSQRAVDGIQDVLNCRLTLEKEFGIIVRGMAYPDSGIAVFNNGANYGNIKQYLTDLDIAYARTLGGDNDTFALPTDWHAWMPTAHHANPKIFDYIKEFTEVNLSKMYSSARFPRLFYLWGHSYEFERNNNWELLEGICEKMANKEDIWYATNIEIYDYVNAYNSLVFSADSSIIHNPSLQTVWFAMDGKNYVIESGEILNLQKL